MVGSFLLHIISRLKLNCMAKESNGIINYKKIKLFMPYWIFVLTLEDTAFVESYLCIIICILLFSEL